MNEKPASIEEDDDPLDQEVDFINVRPNPFARDYGRNRNLRVLSPDLLDRFPDSDSVDEALRTYIRLTSGAPKKVSASTAAAPKPKKKKA
jgi:hypothetical protein